MIVVRFLVLHSPLGWEPYIMEPQGANKEHAEQYQVDEEWHNTILCCCILDVLLAHSE